MKANAPEKIYLHPTAKGKVGASWLTFPLTNEDIEYTRTNAFIEKAAKWMKRKSAIRYHLSEELIEDFKEAMKL